MTADPAAVLRAAANLAEQRAWATGAVKGDNHAGRRWLPEWFTGPRQTLTDWDAEHIAAADPAFMLTVAAWWRWVADNQFDSMGNMIWGAMVDAALPSALAYLRQDTP